MSGTSRARTDGYSVAVFSAAGPMMFGSAKHDAALMARRLHERTKTMIKEMTKTEIEAVNGGDNPVPQFTLTLGPIGTNWTFQRTSPFAATIAPPLSALPRPTVTAL